MAVITTASASADRHSPLGPTALSPRMPSARSSPTSSAATLTRQPAIARSNNHPPMSDTTSATSSATTFSSYCRAFSGRIRGRANGTASASPPPRTSDNCADIPDCGDIGHPIRVQGADRPDTLDRGIAVWPASPNSVTFSRESVKLLS